MDELNHTERYRQLLKDPKLLQWLIAPTEELSLYWKDIMTADRGKKKDIDDLQYMFKRIKVAEKPLSSEDKNVLWRRIDAEYRKTKRIKLMRRTWQYAAVLIILVVSSLYLLLDKEPPHHEIDYQQMISEMKLNESNSENVLLVLSDTEKVEVSDKKVEVEYDEKGNLRVNSQKISEDGAVEEAGVKYNQLFVPYGKTSLMMLSDGTRLWVNSGSRLIYPTSFKGKKREIFLEGEIYIEVAKNKDVPFVVKTNTLEVNVLGTSFNISAYSNDETHSVVLANGAVAVKSNTEEKVIHIEPNQKYTFQKTTNQSKLEPVDVFSHICWRHGFLMSDSNNLSDVLKKIERFYNKRLVYDVHEMDKIAVRGKLDLKENPEETLQVIAITAPIRYAIKDDYIELSVKP